MKNNKFTIFVTALVFLLIPLSTIKASASDISGNIHNEMIATFDTDNTSQEALDSIKQIAQEDSDVHVLISSDKIIVTENLGTSEDTNLKVNNKMVKVDNGHFRFNINTSKPIKLQYSDPNIDSKENIIKTSSKNINLVNQISYSEMIKNMDEMNNMNIQDTSEKSSLFDRLDNLFFLRASASTSRYTGQKDGQKVSKGTHVHCNRFNGTKSNHRYYSRLKAQGWVNYYKSDCWYKHKDYKCPFTKKDTNCDGLLKSKAHNCSVKGKWPVTCWYRN